MLPLNTTVSGRKVKASFPTSSNKQERQSLGEEIDHHITHAEVKDEEEHPKRWTSSRPAEVKIRPGIVASTFNMSTNTTSGKWELSASELMPIPTGLKEFFEDLDVVAKHSGDYLVQRRVLIDAILFKSLKS
ncbi:hypothetical protein AtubIFM56815_009256 [Aspergillus tubingensis]|uniref:Uncharacterized protein n=2 Tax=Aspergillus tubingensis TaxID=5068 RepID=A0A1L9MTJ6_ASPTC|nr:hypothetical protein ASPTUDRAFT_193751 [Aspergillus tubingensis CBS 134.48]GLA85032.1 hypothetical protein AtubIFM56815_009256 [Aspergillus tubingensis]